MKISLDITIAVDFEVEFIPGKYKHVDDWTNDEVLILSHDMNFEKIIENEKDEILKRAKIKHNMEEWRKK